ncbi:MAG: hypothetical protein LC715_01400 [Gammaproteobacteria bacterium]|nr:hypothetical protein [Gammaproteobacteria bacterium]
MATIRILTACILLALCASADAQTKTQKKLYCWTENGRKVCGDALPAEAAERARTEINAKSGLRSGEVARALTASERADAAAVAERARIQAEAQAAQQRRDLAMVESYTTEAELRRAYGARIVLVDESLKASVLGEANLRRSLLGLLNQAADMELAGKPVTAALTANIRLQHDELQRQLRILAAQRSDRATLDDELEDALRRYRALKKPQQPADPLAQQG